MGENALARDRPRSAGLTPDAPRHVGRCGVAHIAELADRIGGASGAKWLWIEPCQHPGHDVTRPIVSGATTERRKPCFVVPGDDGPLTIHAQPLVDDVRRPVVLPRHLVLPGQLHSHRPAHRLRQQCRIERDRVRAVDPITARPPHENDPDIVGGESEQRCDAASRRIRGLRRRPDRRLGTLDVGDGHRRAHRAVHLVGMTVRGRDDRRGPGQRFVHVFRVDRERVA